MSNPKTRAYRVAVAVAFGLTGFGVNFLDIKFVEGATFKISILAGLFFPLVLSLAWGWRYGLLSALAGGCQAMWWLWQGDGWGVLYSVPVFTLWIVWHGWWAERRSEGHPWYVSSFVVEIPFRIVIELGFLVVFRWLVSLNPPPWNPAISWDHVSPAWLQTVAVKHVVEDYVLLMAAYVALSLGAVRRFFGLPPRFAQRDTSVIYAGAALFGLLLWALDALVHYFLFPREGQTFWGIAVHGASAHELFMRSVYVMTTMLAGVVLARLNRRRAELQELLDHRNRILAAIRNVNQLIVREKDPHRLLNEACRLLVENQGYYNVWIVLTADGHPKEPFFHAGFDGGFALMAERLRAGDLTICAQAALSSDGVQVKIDPPAQCEACPLASKYAERAGLSLRLEHAGCVFGWISLSCPHKFARSAEEHDLLREVAGDIAYALWSIETETQRETLDRKYAAVLSTTLDAAVAVNLDGRITVFNPGAEKLFGCTADEALGSPITRFCPEDRLEQQAEMVCRVRDTGAVTGYDSERLTADGRRIPVEITLGLNTDDKGRPLGISAILRDISERKQAEEALRQSHAMLVRTERIANVGSWEWDIAGDRVCWSDELFRIFGRAPANGAPSFAQLPELYLPEDMQRLREAIERCVSQGTPYQLELRAIRSNGEIRHCIAWGQAKTDETDRVVRLAGSLQDITERMKQEEHIALLGRMLDDAPASITIHDVAGCFLYANRKTFSLHGYDENEFMAINLHDLDVPESEALLEERFRQIAEKGEASFEVGHFHKDGTIFPLQILAKQIQWEGRPVVLSIASDISERRMAEEALRKSEWYLRSTLDGLSAHIAVLDDKGEIILTNKAYRDFGEWNSVEFGAVSEGSNYHAVCDAASGEHSEEAKPVAEGIREVLSGKRGYFELEYPCHSPDEKRWFVARVTSFTGEGPRRVIVAHENITGRKQAEMQLRLQSLVLNQIRDRVTVTDLDGVITYVNDAEVRALGYSRDELIGVSTEKYGEDPERGVTQRKIVQETLEHGQWRGEVINQTADGKEVTLDCRTQVVFDEQGRRIALAGVSTDITERKRMEEALRESEMRFRFLVDHSYDLIWTLTSDGVLSYVSPSWKSRLGYESSSLLGKAFQSFVHPDDVTVCEDYLSRVLAAKSALPGPEYRVRHADGSWRWHEAGMTPVYTQDGSFMDFVGVSRDITERKWAEEAAKQEQIIEQTIIESVPGAFYMIDVNGRYARWNAYQRDVIVGKPDNQVATTNALDTIHPDDRLLVGAKIAAVLKNGVDEILEGRVLLHGGPAYQWMLMTGRQVIIQGNPFLIGIGIDITERKRTEEESARSAALVRDVVDMVPAYICAKNSEGRFLLVNRKIADFYGIPIETMTGKLHADLCEDKAELRAMLAADCQVIESGRAVVIPEETMRKPDGNIAVLETYKIPFTADGKPAVLIASVDITERKQAEEAAKEASVRLSLATKAGGVGVWEYDIIHNRLQWEEQMYTLYGIGRETFGGAYDSWLASVHPEDIARADREVEMALRGEKEFDTEFRVVWPDGTVRHIQAQATVLRDADGKPLRMIGTNWDFTEREQAQTMLRESDERFRAANDASLDALLLLRSERDVTGEIRDFVFVEVNRRTEEMLRMSRDQLLGKRLCEVLPIIREAGLFEKYKRVVDTGVSEEEEFFLPDTHMPGAWYYHQVVKVHDGIFICHRDIGEQKRAEAERESLQSQLNQAQKMEAVGRLAGGVAHDFNNMLGVIIGHADLILEQMEPNQPFQDDLMEIRKAGVRSADLTRQLLAFARKQTVAPKVIDLNDTLEGMLKMLRRLIGEDIDLAWRPGKEVWPVIMDPAQIDQILANLCVNARDAMADVGKMTIETGNTVFDGPYCKEHLGSLPGDYVLLAVSDNGCGMDSETMSHLFEPFFTTKELGKGTGLGLATVYGVVKQNNGFINVYSEPGQGTTFKIYLPRHLTKTIPLPEKKPDKPGERGHETVLLVEDEPAILKITTMMLEREGYTVVRAGTPGEAIRLANEHAGDIHLLMTDVVMPEMNGRDLAKNILSRYPHLKCLFMSGYTADVIAHHGVLDEGVNFIQKPFSIRDLTVKVREVLKHD